MADVPELLAPAGDWEALRAAVANGADAVYFGLEQFNARHRAANFTTAELPEVMAYLHQRGVRGYVAFNILIFSTEWPQALAALHAIQAARVDAVIVQDLGLAWLIRQCLPELHVHASTQTTMTEPRGIELLRQQLGIQRVILARELALADIQEIHRQTPMPLEVFVHGALCVAYSGQCLTSEALGGRSANRGQCAQACRMPYDMLVDGVQHDLGDRAYLLSPGDLAAYDLVPDLVAAGVCSFKIEGRLKGGPYVAATCQTYRAALDAAQAQQPFAPTPSQRHDLEQTFSRGLFHGFLRGVNHQRTAPARFPKHRGVCLGRVVGTTGRGVLIHVENELLPAEELLRPGVGLLIDESRPEEDEPAGHVLAVHPRPGQPRHFEAIFRHEDVDPRRVHVGSLVWKTQDPQVRRRLERSYARDLPVIKRPLSVRVTGSLGGPLHLTFTLNSGQSTTVEWPGPLAQARTQPADADFFVRQLDRLGDTPFTLGAVEVELPPGLMVPASIVNQLRREAVTRLEAAEGSTSSESIDVQPFAEPAKVLDRLRAEARRLASPPPAPEPPRLAVLVRSRERLEALAVAPETGRPDLVYCDFEDVRRYRQAVQIARAAGLPIGLATLRVVKPKEESWLRLMVSYRPDGILARNLASIAFFRDHAPELPLVGDFALNVVNEFAAAWHAQLGLTRLTPGFDLNWEQFQALMRAADPAWFEPVIHYHMPMFHMEHCVFAAFLSTGADWRDCGRPCDRHRVELRGEQQAAFPVLADAGCRNTVYNALPQSAAEFLPAMLQLGLRHFRIELLRESAAEASQVIGLYRQVLGGTAPGRDVWRELRSLHQLGVTRGTLRLL
ncbi:MAG TPA: DUF3656 domain-containing protein [Gemmatales bacterium]|nr:DUF3656 domain-containing protein [Gemmatales bacterium]